MKALLRTQYHLIGGLKTALFCAALPLLFALLRITLFRTAAEPGINVSDGFFPVVTAAFVISMLLPCIITAETGSRWSEYVKALPYSPEQLVDSKYVFSILCAAFAAVTAAAVLPLLMLRNPALLSDTVYTSAANAALMYAATAAAIVLQFSAVLYPLHFRRRYDLPTFLSFAVLLGIIMLPYLLHIPIETAGRPAEAFLPDTHKLPLRMLADAAVCYPLSWLLSRKSCCATSRRKEESV